LRPKGPRTQCTELKLTPMTAAATEGFSKFEDVVLAGQTPDGKDASNELTYLILESTRSLPITTQRHAFGFTPRRPTPAASRRGSHQGWQGLPKLLNDERVIPFYLANGATLKEALDWNVSGCMESRLINRETQCTGNGIINYGSVVEMTFRNGKLKVHKDLPFGRRPAIQNMDQLRPGLEGVLHTARASGQAVAGPAVRCDETEAAVFCRACNIHAARPGNGALPRSPLARRVHPGRDRPILSRNGRQGYRH